MPVGVQNAVQCVMYALLVLQNIQYTRFVCLLICV